MPIVPSVAKATDGRAAILNGFSGSWYNRPPINLFTLKFLLKIIKFNRHAFNADVSTGKADLKLTLLARQRCQSSTTAAESEGDN